jgi:hypothetical protein
MAKTSNPTNSVKRIGVDKANTRIVTITAGAAFLVIFFLVASFSLLGQLTYQNRIISTKKAALSQLKKNITARDSLVKSYTSFADSAQNFIGGSSSGSGAQDGNNGKLVLDALPSKYDFPALTASLEKIANDQKVSIEGLTGSDDTVAQLAQTGDEAKPIEMPFEFKVSGDYAGIQRTVDAIDRSIRPIQVQKLDITGDPSQISLDIIGVSYYQPAKALNIKTKVVK